MLIQPTRSHVSKQKRPPIPDAVKRKVFASQWVDGAVRDVYTAEPIKTRLLPTKNRFKKGSIDHVLPLSADPELKYYHDPTNMQGMMWYDNSQIKTDSMTWTHTQFEALRRGEYLPGFDKMREKIDLAASLWNEKQGKNGICLPFWWYGEKLKLWGYNLKTGEFEISPEESYRREQRVKDKMLAQCLKENSRLTISKG